MFANQRQRSKGGEYVGRAVESITLTGTQESSRKENRLASSNSEQVEATTIEDAKGKTVQSAILTGTRESSEAGSFAQQKEARLIKIHNGENVYSVSFLVDGKHVVSGDAAGRIRRWRIEDGKEVGTPMHVKGSVFNIAVSRDGKWVISGTGCGLVTVWNAESHSKMTEWKGHNKEVNAVDVSLDGTKIATGSDDGTVCVWSLSTGERLLGPFNHDNSVATVKFSPDGRLIATATWDHDSVRVYDSQNGRRLVKFPIKVAHWQNQSLVWANDNKQLFVLSGDGNIHCLNVSTRKTLSRWRGGVIGTKCIVMASNGTFIAVSTRSSVSLWDTTTYKKIECVIHHTTYILSMAISSNYDLVTAGWKEITVRNLRDVLPSPYSCMRVEKTHLKEAEESLPPQEESSSTSICSPTHFVDIRAHLGSKIARLEKIVQELRDELAASQRAASQKEGNLSEIIESLSAKEKSSSVSTAILTHVH